MDFSSFHCNKVPYILVVSITLVSCGGGSSDSNPVTNTPINLIASPHYFRDLDSSTDEIGGTLHLQQTNVADEQVTSVRLYWADASNHKNGGAWLNSVASNDFKVTIPDNTPIPANTSAFLMYPINEDEEEGTPSVIKFHDFIGNTLISGPGGIADALKNTGDDHPSAGDGVTRDGAWYYGGLSTNDRPKIEAFRSDLGGGTCVYDNGLVAVTDMANGKDANWEANSKNGKANTVNEADYPAFSFLCDEMAPENFSFEVPRVRDEHGAWSYSALNDAMFYGTEVYDTYLKYLGEPPLEDKIRLRAHYGEENNLIDVVYWDGVYANLNGIMDKTKMVALDIIAHEVAHGVLSNISSLKAFESELSTDAFTLHEAFSDISGVLAKYEYTGQLNWIHGEESRSSRRSLDKIKTEVGAIDSFFDYDDAGADYYKRIGMISYPFYLLTSKWGIEDSYKIIIHAARNCWTNQSTLTHAATCIEQSAVNNGFAESDVEDAFKAVKIKLFEEGVLSHFNTNKDKLTVTFTDNSQSTGTVDTWLWDFGDGTNSNLVNPVHTYAIAGDYKVTLTVSDSTGDQDNFERSLTISTE